MMSDNYAKHNPQNSNKKLKSSIVEVDMISELPVVLIQHILSFLDIEEIVQTSLLSKRWQFIWTCNSKIDDLCLYLSKQDKVSDTYKVFAPSLRFSVECTLKNKARDINVIWRNTWRPREDELIQNSHSSLLISLTIAPQVDNIDWRCLKKLNIENVELSAYDIGKVLSGCPVLEYLSLIDIRGLRSLNLSSRNLTALVIQEGDEYYQYEEVLDISAPYLHDLLIVNNVLGLRIKLKNISSVIRAELNFSGICYLSRPFVYTSPESTVYINQLFDSLQFVKELQLGSGVTEVFSKLEMKGWNLPPKFRVPCLTLDAYEHVGSVPGILAVLKSFPFLENLLIKGVNSYDEEDHKEHDVVNRYDTLDLTLNYLKTVEIKNFIGLFGGADPFVRLLLKSAKILKRLDISIDGDFNLYNVALKLVTFPKASPEVVFMFK